MNLRIHWSLTSLRLSGKNESLCWQIVRMRLRILCHGTDIIVPSTRMCSQTVYLAGTGENIHTHEASQIAE